MDTERVGDGKQHRRKQSQRLYPSQLFSCTLCLLTAATQWESRTHVSKWLADASTGTHLGKAKNMPQLSICEPSHLGPSFVHSPRLLVDHDHRAGTAAGMDRLALGGLPLSPLPSAPSPTISRHPVCAKGTDPVLVLQKEEQDLDGETGPSSAGPVEDDGEGFSFKYSPGKLRGNQYKKMMTKEELEEEQRTEE
uniref:Matrix remodeling associated 7 n=1 Tax=Colobus angolensis palliatus TaxID=336983 RepID=A0A2K5H8M7_COLAP